MSENPAGTLSQRARHSNTRRTKSPSVEASRPGTHSRAGRTGHCDTCPTEWATSLCFSQHTWPALQRILGSATDFCLHFTQSKSGWFDTIYGARESATYYSSKVFERHFVCFPNSVSLIKVMVKLWNILAILITVSYLNIFVNVI